MYHHPDDERKLPENRHFNQFRTNNNVCEMNFCGARDESNDMLFNYQKHHSRSLMKVDLQTKQDKKVISGNTVSVHRLKTRLNSRQNK